MRDQGLQQAIRAVGGISELARRIGISQPSVSNWERIPAERVLSVEAATGVARGVLRPDLFAAESAAGIDEVDAARAAGIRAARHLAFAQPGRRLLGRLAASARRCQSARDCACGPRRSCCARRRRARWAGVFRSLHRSGPRRVAALRVLLSDGLPARASAWRACAATSSGLASSRPRASRSPRITPRSSARSCPVWRAAQIEAPAGADREIFEKHMAPWIGRFFATWSSQPDGGLLRPRRRARPDLRGNRN